MEKKFTLVAAFDIGRTRSTYAYSFRDEQRNTTFTENWTNAINGETGQTTSTTVLLDADQAFHSFGFEADGHFEALTDDQRRQGWRMFSCFSASLNDYKKLDDKSTVTDTDRQTYPALTIFAMAIKYLYGRLLDKVRLYRFGIEQDEIKCVFLVPAIWSENGKRFMRQAAQLAGINIPNIGVEFASEAAVANLTLYANESLHLQVTNSEHIVIGLHGEKADITLQTMSKGKTKIQHAADIDDIFNNQHTFRILQTFIGHKLLNEFKRNDYIEYCNFINNFERKMRLQSGSSEDVNVTMPFSLLEIAFSNSDGSTRQQRLRSRLSIPFSDLKKWFDEPIDRVIREVLKGPDAMVVAAFDIGTTYSGYAFSFKDEPTNVFTNPAWVSNGMSAFKTATSILLDKMGFFTPLDLTLKKNLLIWLKRINTVVGDYFENSKWFSIATRLLHGHLLRLLQSQDTTLCESDISYLITVPAIWDDSAKQFMREAAIMAGIDGDRLKLALEPEVAALWCKKTILKDNKQDDTPAISSKYIVIDVGGGTADVSIHQILPSGDINVINKPSGGPWGGVCVDEAFLEYLRKTFGTTVIDDFKKNDIGEFFDLIMTFETKKRKNIFTLEEFIVHLPLTLNDIIIAQPRKTPQIRKGKLAVKTELLQNWFDDPIIALCTHVKELMASNKIHDVRTLFLVGGFCESPYVQKRIKEELPGIHVICPAESSLAVLKGAVLFGRFPDIFATRVMKYTYGISVYKAYDPKKHREEDRKEVKGQSKVAKCFQIFVRANESVNVRHKIKHSTKAVGGTPVIRVYRTLEENPEYTTDPGCELLGILRVPDDKEKRGDMIDVIFIFAETEISVKTKYSSSEKEDLLLLDCLSVDNSSL